MRKAKLFAFTFLIVMLAGILLVVYYSKQTEAKDVRQIQISKGSDKPEKGDIRELSFGYDAEMEDDPQYQETTGAEGEMVDITTDDYYIEDTAASNIVVPSESGQVTFSFAGDILFDPGYSVYASYLQRGSEVENCFSEEILEKMRSADIMMVNNEFPYSDRGTPLQGKMFTFRASTESVSLLSDLGVDVVAIANNHLYDYGETAFTDTLDTLAEAGIPYAGGGRDIDEASSPVVFNAEGCKIAVLAGTQIEKGSYPDTKGATDTTPGVFRCYNPDRLCQSVREAKEKYDFVVVYVHWGTESTTVLDYDQVSLAKQLAEAGADVIIGDHPHVLQGITWIGDTPVIYSLGNYWFNSKTLDTCIVTLAIDTKEKKLLSFKFEPCLQSGMKVSLHEGSEKARVLNYMKSLSTSVNIDDEGFVTKKG